MKDKPFTRWAYQAYDGVSDFGRSVTRPLISLIFFGILFSALYGFILFDAKETQPYIPTLWIVIPIILGIFYYIFKIYNHIQISLFRKIPSVFIFVFLSITMLLPHTNASLSLSATYSLPFYSAAITGRTALEKIVLSEPVDCNKEEIKKEPNKCSTPEKKKAYENKRSWFAVVGILQGIISGAFLFLIALALRNRFRS